ncbi:hypothetical protein LTR36_004985 [Oleoguttula mirabilis]|uniref:SAP domain-containing protein n=1 Tax=Oleoguttula mirabilis TaxID=1507867 RepID=A0AAV9JVC6_9PEZI|nr:hypothetical protein LTR36_004985 [Oleoguttula mirabilis]
MNSSNATHLSRRLLDLKASKLKHVAFLMGLPSTGSKPELDTVIRHHLHDRQTPFHGGRVVSVDMGIRNLAFCVLDIPPLGPEPRLGKQPLDSPLTVSHWLKRDLLSAAVPVEDGPAEQPIDDATAKTEQSRRKRKPAVTASIPKTAFTPSVLSKTAYDITAELMSYKPSAILIERQRFRSGGAAAIQEWTVRVNMLESMIWACLQTMRQTSKHGSDAFPSVHEVSPARVSRFWTAASNISLRPTDGMLSPGSNDEALPPANALERRARKVQKNDKIAIVRSWLDRVEPVDVSLAFNGEAAETADAFGIPTSRASRKGGSAGSGEGVAPAGKLDDLADCLLQGVAWVRWEENSRRLGRLLDDACD